MKPMVRSVAFLLAAIAACSAWLWFYSAGRIGREMEKLIQLEISRAHFSGVVLVSRGGKTLFEKAYGLANAEWGIANTTNTKFEIGSITKPFTATLVMQLEQEGRLALNDPICKYLTPCPTEWVPITVHHLLSNTSGIFNAQQTKDFEIQSMTPWTREEISQKRRIGSLTFAPGEKFEYNNSNYYFLGLIIERVTGQPFETVLRQRILEPLGMHDTGLVSREHLMQARASGYQLDAQNQVGNSTRPLNPMWSFSAGAMYSTVEDMQKWGEALRRSTLLPRDTLERMWQPVKAGYGYGWLVPFAMAQTPQRRVIEHGGRVPGFSSSFSLMPDEKLMTIVLANNIASDPMRLARGLSAIALGEPYISPLVREPASIAVDALKRYEGDYELDGVIWTMRAHNGRLFSRPNEYPDEIEILPDSDTTFFLHDSDVSLRAQLDDKGRVIGLIVTPGGQVAKKVN